MKRIAIALAAFSLLFASCVSQPAPASETPDPAAQSSVQAGGNQEYKDRAVALVQGESGTRPAGTATAQPAPAGSAAAAAPAAAPGADPSVGPGPGDPLTDQERAFLETYLSRLSYLVYYDEAAGIAPQLAKTAVSQANRYLIEQRGLSVIDFDTVERNKRDYLTAYQAETGGSISMIQYIAQRNNADVYVELSFTVSSSTSGGRYYATAQGSMKIFDTSTAQLLGSVAFQSPQTMSTSSVDAAVTNAISASVWSAMPRMMDQSKGLIEGSLRRGVRYELVLQKTPDSRAVSNFRRFLERSVAIREVEQASYSTDETKLFLFSFQTQTRVEDAIYDAAERAGMPDAYLVFSRGKAFVFNSGL